MTEFKFDTIDLRLTCSLSSVEFWTVPVSALVLTVLWILWGNNGILSLYEILLSLFKLLEKFPVKAISPLV